MVAPVRATSMASRIGWVATGTTSRMTSTPRPPVIACTRSTTFSSIGRDTVICAKRSRNFELVSAARSTCDDDGAGAGALGCNDRAEAALPVPENQNDIP